MNIKSIYAFVTLFSSMTAAYAAPNDLKIEREQVIKQYVMDLQSADAQDISALFEDKGIVISTSKGKVNATDFFYSFFPAIESAHTELHQLFINNTDDGRYAARFHFNFKLKDNEEGDGEYVDEFVFANNSSKLIAVYMFENLKFDNLAPIK